MQWCRLLHTTVMPEKCSLDLLSCLLGQPAVWRLSLPYITKFFVYTRFQLRSKMDSDSGDKIDNGETVECNLDDVHRYVQSKEYHAGLSKVQKRRICEKASCSLITQVCWCARTDLVCSAELYTTPKNATTLCNRCKLASLEADSSVRMPQYEES